MFDVVRSLMGFQNQVLQESALLWSTYWLLFSWDVLNVFILCVLFHVFLSKLIFFPDKKIASSQFERVGIIKKGGTASLRSRTCAKHNAVFSARFKSLSLYFLYQKGNLICVKRAFIHI